MITNEALHKKSPQELTSLLYEALLERLEEAGEAMQAGDMWKANEKFQKANDILTRLGAGINYEAGIIADQLDTLYNYLSDQLVQVNYKKDIKMLEEVIKLIQSIMAAWREAMKTQKDSQPKMMKQRVSAYEKNTVFE
ncbi:flagellar export chaperone FliS [Alkalicoccus daliensis]|uniref:Flagellar secretion chaperone FliS n=1 Tax=Alkalicoccus daliensis TaxID=745820 RepID=A0A1H0B1Z6_9BACI|nr:flagellar export chaperone FliS [Alkalicoccus daliensis]SDN39670.1 flagellar protein FliS [Alkalicoccus daliensis]